MLAAMLKEHQRAQDDLKVEINNKRVIAERAVSDLTSRNVRLLNDNVSRAYMNQHRLDSEIRKLKVNVNKLSKQSQQWVAICNGISGAIKELGDIRTWTTAIEDDIQFISNAIKGSCKPTTDDT